MNECKIEDNRPVCTARNKNPECMYSTISPWAECLWKAESRYCICIKAIKSALEKEGE
jgi:hypothetical protein